MSIYETITRVDRSYLSKRSKEELIGIVELYQKANIALESALKDGEWMDIETAPNDEYIHVFAWDARGVISPEYKDDYPPMQAITKRHESAGFCVCDLREVTHWMPLPPAPSEVKKDV